MESEFPKFGVVPTERTYRAFVQMLTRTTGGPADIALHKTNTALALVKSMESQGIQPSQDVRVQPLGRNSVFE